MFRLGISIFCFVILGLVITLVFIISLLSVGLTKVIISCSHPSLWGNFGMLLLWSNLSNTLLIQSRVKVWQRWCEVVMGLIKPCPSNKFRTPSPEFPVTSCASFFDPRDDGLLVENLLSSFLTLVLNMHDMLKSFRLCWSEHTQWLTLFPTDHIWCLFFWSSWCA